MNVRAVLYSTVQYSTVQYSTVPGEHVRDDLGPRHPLLHLQHHRPAQGGGFISFWLYITYNLLVFKYCIFNIKKIDVVFKTKKEWMMAGEHICSICDYQAIKRSNLKRHIQTKHTGVKFPCQIWQNKDASKIRSASEVENLEATGCLYKLLPINLV